VAGRENGVYAWKVPTSIFFGITPVTADEQAAAGGSEVDDDGHPETPALKFKCAMHNPAENREQEENFKTGKFTGFIIRGEGAYGIATQKTEAKGLPGLVFESAGNMPVPDMTEEAILAQLIELSSYVQNEWKDTPGAHFPQSHWSDLCCGASFGPMASQFSRVMAVVSEIDSNVSWQITTRIYGGGNWRVCMLYKALPTIMGLGRISIPEMWGEKRIACEGENLIKLVGVEMPTPPGSGNARYVRLAAKDALPGFTYWIPLSPPQVQGATAAEGVTPPLGEVTESLERSAANECSFLTPSDGKESLTLPPIMPTASGTN